MQHNDPKLDDFRNVLFLVFRQILKKDPTPVQYDIAHYMQHGPERLVIEAFRGEGKSWIASIFSVDRLRKNPDLNVFVASASGVRAAAFTTFSRRLIEEVPIFQHLQPRKGQRDSNLNFDVAGAPNAHAPSMKAVGITGQMAGSRGDLIIADDIEVPNNSGTPMMREKLSEAVKEFDAIVKPNGRIMYLGTPQTEQSIYNQLPGRGYKLRIWPARYPDEAQSAFYGDTLAPKIAAEVKAAPELVGKPTDPQRFDEQDLIKREMSYGRSGFALQFMLDTRLSDALRYPLKLSDLCFMDLNVDVAPQRVIWARSPELELRDVECPGFNGDRFYRPMALDGGFVPYNGAVLAIDPAGHGGDEVGLSVVKHLNSQLFVPVCTGLAGGYGEANLVRIAETARDQKVNKLIVEENFGDGMFAELLKPVLARIYPCSIEEVRHNIQKEKRIIDTLEPVMNSHRLVFSTRVAELDVRHDANIDLEVAHTYRLFHQMSRITRDRGCLAHDDRLDALAIGVSYWTQRMSLDVVDAMGAQQKAAEEEALRKFVEDVTGKKDKGEGWLDCGMRHRRR